MKIAALHIGMKVRHPQLGVGVVKGITEQAADVRFDEGMRSVSPETSGLEPAEPHASITGLEQPLHLIIAEAAAAAVRELGIEKPDATLVEQLGARWHRGKVVLHPADATTQSKEVPLETFFHKVVMMRNNLRVLEQKINSNPTLTDGEKVELQQYITRCYGSMTTFNVLFKSREDQFRGGSQNE